MTRYEQIVKAHEYILGGDAERNVTLREISESLAIICDLLGYPTSVDSASYSEIPNN